MFSYCDGFESKSWQKVLNSALSVHFLSTYLCLHVYVFTDVCTHAWAVNTLHRVCIFLVLSFPVLFQRDQLLFATLIFLAHYIPDLSNGLKYDSLLEGVVLICKCCLSPGQVWLGDNYKVTATFSLLIVKRKNTMPFSMRLPEPFLFLSQMGNSF